MYKIGFIGNKDSILGFKALGCDIFPAETSQEAREILLKKASENYAIIFITEGFAKDIQNVIEKYKDEITPSIVPIPSNKGSLGLGIKGVRSAMERAIGTDILFKN